MIPPDLMAPFIALWGILSVCAVHALHERALRKLRARDKARELRRQSRKLSHVQLPAAEPANDVTRSEKKVAA